MIAQKLITATVVEGRVVPWWLTERDHPWLAVLLEHRRALVGEPRRTWETVLTRSVHASAHPRKQALAAEVVRRQTRPKRPSWPVHPREVRAGLFRRAATGTASRADCVRRTAQDLGLTPETVEELLFQDLASERPLPKVPEDLDPTRLALSVNLALAQGLVARARHVTIRLRGQAHRVVRAARLRGLICEVETANDGAEARLRLSGPLALFHRTRLYGKALASLIPTLRWCDDFRLAAPVVWPGGEGTLVLDPSAPLPAATEGRRYDSKLEERFATDFLRTAPDWELTRDPAPLRAGQGLVFPDFALRHRQGLAPPALLELVGFWTPAYLDRKLARYRQARAPRLILAIDQAHLPAPEELPRGARVVAYRNRLDPKSVLALLEASTHAAPPTCATPCSMSELAIRIAPSMPPGDPHRQRSRASPTDRAPWRLR